MNGNYVQILDGIRHQKLPLNALIIVIKGKIVDKFKELCVKGQLLCAYFQQERLVVSKMLSTLDSKMCKLKWVDEIDETTGSRNWDKTAAKKLEMLNKDCNMTAGLEAEFSIAVGARVML